MLYTPMPAPESTPQTFRTFATGPQNALAYNAALTVARTPGVAYNPLYLTGGVGAGKTHLLRAVGAYLTPRLKEVEVIIVSGDGFSQDFITHLRRGNMLAFRRRYRHAGALLVDGVSALAGRDAVAEELVHTLDALREANRQIVVTDEQRPAEVRGLSERLRSRLGSSLVVTLNPPDEATRLAILRQKAAHWGLLATPSSDPVALTPSSAAYTYPLSDDALVALAARVRGSVRDLEGVLLRVASAAVARNCQATATLALQVASDANRAARQPRGRAQVDAVIQAVCDYYGLARQVLLGKSREMTVAQARQVAMYLLREDAGLTATQVGQELGRDHSTVLHGHARIATALGSNDAIMNVVLENIRKSVGQMRPDPA